MHRTMSEQQCEGWSLVCILIGKNMYRAWEYRVVWCAGLVAGLTIPLEEKQERSRREGGHGRRASLAFDREALHIYRHVRTECSLTIYLYAFKLIYSFDLFIFFGGGLFVDWTTSNGFYSNQFEKPPSSYSPTLNLALYRPTGAVFM